MKVHRLRPVSLDAFDNADSAMIASKAISSEFTLEALKARLIGHNFKQYRAEEQQVVLKFDEAGDLRISVSGGILHCGDDIAQPFGGDIPEIVLVEFGGAVHRWLPLQVLNAFLDSELRSVQLFPYEGYFGFKNRPLLAFRVLQDIDAGYRRLYWTESE